jgi:hypothetical protein
MLKIVRIEFGQKIQYTVEPQYNAPRYNVNLDLVRKISCSFSKKTFKIDLDFTQIFFGPFNRTISRFDCSAKLR